MKILVIDDDLDFLESLHLMLIMNGHTVNPVADGRESVTTYEEFEPDVVLLDINMPGMDGYEVFNRLKQRYADAKIYFMSGYSLDNEKYKAAKSQSLAGLLIKPIGLSDLVKILV